MHRLIPLALAAALALAGCGTVNDAAMSVGDKIAETADQGAPYKATIDGMIPINPTLEERAARACLVAAAAAELVTNQARQGNAIKPDDALGAVERLRGTCQAALTTDARWTNTTLAYVAHDIMAVVAVAAKQRGLAIVPLAATLNPFGLLDQGVSVMAQIDIGAALLRDIRQGFDDLHAGAAAIDDLRTAATRRLDLNARSLRTIMGVPPT